MWTKKEIFAIGGLREIGFKPKSDLLMVLSSQGRGIFDCEKAEKIDRDYFDYYMEEWDSENGKVEGFGVLDSETIICGGFEFQDPLSKKTFDDWTIEIREENRSNWKGEIQKSEVLFLVNGKEKIEIETFHYGIDRAYGFSDTGNSFVYGTPSDLHIWTKSKNDINKPIAQI